MLKMNFALRRLAFGLLALGAFASAAAAQAVRAPEDFRARSLARDDDNFSAAVDLGFEVNFFGVRSRTLHVNNNGNITFSSGLSAYTPFDLTSTNQQIIAPFFADVDTRNVASGVTAYGPARVDGRRAFVVNWPGVGYYKQQADLTNDFQLVILDRSDVAEGDFDFEFNYDSIQWESGGDTRTGGFRGRGGSSARAGFSNGTRVNQTYFEIPGSGVSGFFLDDGARGLTRSSNIGVPGRWLFSVRSGTIFETTPEIQELSTPRVRSFR